MWRQRGLPLSHPGSSVRGFGSAQRRGYVDDVDKIEKEVLAHRHLFVPVARAASVVPRQGKTTGRSKRAKCHQK